MPALQGNVSVLQTVGETPVEDSPVVIDGDANASPPDANTVPDGNAAPPQADAPAASDESGTEPAPDNSVPPANN